MIDGPMRPDDFSPARLRLARRRRRMQVRELADAIGVKPQAVSNYENGSRVPDAEGQALLAQVLGFEVSFFNKRETDDLSVEALSFRAVSSLTQSLQQAAAAAGQIAVEFSKFLENRFDLPSVDLPDLHGEDPEVAASLMRDHAGLDPGPIDSIVELLEAHGCRVFSLAEDTTKVDAFSFWRDEVPYVLLNTLKSPERSRFDAAHELGHLLLHRRQATSGRDAEREADAFASALLMDESVVNDVSAFVTLNEVLPLKRRWGVSTGAFVRRLHTLEHIRDWDYRELCIQISAVGGRRREIEPRLTHSERSVALVEMLKSMSADGVRLTDVAKGLGVSRAELEGFLFHLAPTITSGTRELEEEFDAPVVTRAHLTRVK